MGLFDRFKKKDTQKVEEATIRTSSPNQAPFDIEYGQSSDGRYLQVEFHDNRADFKKFYDITRLIVRRQPLDMAGHQVYNCAVSWYGSEDCQMFDEKAATFDSQRALDYSMVLAEIDLTLLQSNPIYCNAVIRALLDKQRVESYLERGLQDSPNIPCGMYIGGIKQTEEGYGKFFSTVVGRASHFSDSMIDKRREHKEALEAKRLQAIEAKRAQMDKLRSEIEDMQK